MKNETPSLKVKKLFPDAKLPTRANPTDSGLDVYAFCFEKIFNEKPESVMLDKSIVLKTNDRVLINAGVALTVGPGYEVQVRPRSGNALNRGLIVVNSPGTIDESYRGALGVIIANIGHEPQEIKIGEKIAQIVVCSVILSEVQEVKELNETVRGSGGFGHTGQ